MLVFFLNTYEIAYFIGISKKSRIHIPLFQIAHINFPIEIISSKIPKFFHSFKQDLIAWFKTMISIYRTQVVLAFACIGQDELCRAFR
jgi:hypothetical protein